MSDDAGKVLITGISGFIAKQCAIEFLDHGYAVRGTVRSLSKADGVRDTLAKHTDTTKLEFAEADLMSDDGWAGAVSGCDFVAHLASPFPLAQPKDENDLIRPAVEGTLRVLEAAAQNGVKRFIQTSSMAAVEYGHSRDRTKPFTEADWSNLEGEGITAYGKSKTLAEQEARKFMSINKGNMSYASVNPGFVLGPVLDRDIGSSAEVILMMLNGKYPGTPRISFSTVDVRDVAKCHRLAMEYNGDAVDRFLAIDRSIGFLELARAITAAIGEDAKRMPKRNLPDMMVKVVAWFDPAVRAIAPLVGLTHQTDNSATREALGMEFIPAEEAAVQTAKSLLALGLVK